MNRQLTRKEIMQLALKVLKGYPAYLKEQEKLERTIAEHPAAGVLKISKKDIDKMCQLILPDKIKFVSIDNAPEGSITGISAKEYAKTHNGFLYEKERDCFKLRFWAQANWIGGATYFVFRIKRNLDFHLFHLDDGHNWNIYNQVAARKLVEKYL